MSINPKFITNLKGQKTGVILSMKEYEKILYELEDIQDIKLYDKIKSKNEKKISLEEYINKKNAKL